MLGCLCPLELWFSLGICPVVGFLGLMESSGNTLCDLNKKEIQKREDVLICICMADSLCCAVDTNNILKQMYSNLKIF